MFSAAAPDQSPMRKMAGVAQAGDSDAMFFGAGDADVDGLLAQALAETELAVEDNDRTAVLDNIDGLIGDLPFLIDPHHVAGNTDHAMAVMAVLVGARRAAMVAASASSRRRG